MRKRWIAAAAATGLLMAADPLVKNPAEFDPLIKQADEAYRKAADAVKAAEAAAVAQARQKRLAVYQSRLEVHTRAGNLDRSKAVREAIEKLDPDHAAEPVERPAALVAHRGHYYAVVLDAKTWHQARAAAAAMGGHLAVLEDEEEAHFVRSLTRPDVPGFWLGASDEEEEGVWRWVDGTVVDIPLAGSVDNATSMEHYLQLRANKTLNDIHNTRLPYLCEWDE